MQKNQLFFLPAAAKQNCEAFNDSSIELFGRALLRVWSDSEIPFQKCTSLSSRLFIFRVFDLVEFLSNVECFRLSDRASNF